MNRLISLKSLAAAAVVLGAFGAASAAHARSDVQFSIGVNTPGVYVQPAPVYVQPRQYYVQPAVVYGSNRGPWGDRDGDGIANVYDHRDDRYRHGRHARVWGDYDRDGTPDRYDRFPANPYRR